MYEYNLCLKRKNNKLKITKPIMEIYKGDQNNCKIANYLKKVKIISSNNSNLFYVTFCYKMCLL